MFLEHLNICATKNKKYTCTDVAIFCEKEIKKNNKKFSIELEEGEYDNSNAHFVSVNGEANLLFSPTALNIGAIAHEVIHFVYLFLCKGIETPFCSETDEIYAYIVGYLVGTIYDLFKKDGLIK